MNTVNIPIWVATQLGQDRRYNLQVTVGEIATDWVTEPWTIEGEGLKSAVSIACVMYSRAMVRSSLKEVERAMHVYKGELKIETGTHVLGEQMVNFCSPREIL